MMNAVQIEEWHNKLPKCGCGRVGRYETPTGLSCNKYMRCDNAEFMAEQIKTLTAERDQWRKDCHTYYDVMRKREDQLVILRAASSALKKALQEIADEIRGKHPVVIALEALKGVQINDY